ncbi:trypsin-like peptidase domain-containing protein [Jidongwangia harbinensis]|uniref:trypsin-like peptidase domain-containing protein n=1 Tax=Jidongwangia harbinensis TaxID=2878561 RepID=UPI001CDA4764|nr:trypsin-like peptidase domain-containing protein [Jidongwangia harbinensis]MCA2211929.1 trypsin-like peptidase domain-containing protein [Jidongwangia harbinensis]
MHAEPAGTREDHPLGTGVVIDDWRVLTCWSVVADRHASGRGVWVAFPKAGVSRSARRRVVSVRADEGSGVAVLVLDEPVPSGVRAAPLLCPDPGDLAGERWWAFGFPADAPLGSDAQGTVGAALAYGWVRLEVESRTRLGAGFLGAGVWSSRFEAVVGVVGRVPQSGDAAALTLVQASQDLPEEKLQALASWSVIDAGESALAAWGWSLDADVEAGRHWRPRARGVAVDSEAGYRFRGRRAALSAVVGWLERGILDDRILIVTGSPGVGKSAVLGRVVTTADAGIRSSLPDDDDAVKAEVGTVSCAVHVKGKTALDVAAEIARAAAVRLPDQVADLAPALCRRLGDRDAPRFNLILDALDEAVSPQQARLIVDDIVLPIARRCGRAGAQVIVGTRRTDDGGDLLRSFGPDRLVVDLDSEDFFEVEDLAAYALATVQLVGAERAGNPYRDPAVAGPVAMRIAELADRNFLVAGLIARRHGLYDTRPVRPNELAFSADVDAALDDYIQRLPPVGRTPAKLALTALAYAHSPGLSLPMWQIMHRALGAVAEIRDLEEFARSSAANFLIESSSDAAAPEFRLFHQALNDALLRERHRYELAPTDQRSISYHLIRHGRAVGWGDVDRYLLRSLPEHAAAGGLIDELLIDDRYLLYADLPRLAPPANFARTILGQQRARLLRLTPQAASADPAERAAQYNVTAALEDLDARIVVDPRAPYRTAWSSVQRRQEWAVFEGHTSAAHAVCAVRSGTGRVLIASGGTDGTVRLWDPSTGQQDGVLLAGGPVSVLCPVAVAGRPMVASAGPDGTVVLWDPDTGQHRHTLHLAPGRIRTMSALDRPGATRIAIGLADGSVRLWDPARHDAELLPGHADEVDVVAGDGDRLGAGGTDGRIRCHVPGGTIGWTVAGHRGAVTAMCWLTLGGRRLLASAGADGDVRLWNADSGIGRLFVEGQPRPVTSLCPIQIRGMSLLATASDDGTVQLWNLGTGKAWPGVFGHGAPVRDLCTVPFHDRVLLVSVGDSTVRCWDPETAERWSEVPGRSADVTAFAAFSDGSRALVACGRGDGVIQLRNAATGEDARILTGHTGPVTTLSAVFAMGDVLLASGAADGSVRVWAHRSPTPTMTRQDKTGWSTALSTAYANRRVYVASAGEHGTIQLWDPYTGRERMDRLGQQNRFFRRRPHGHHGSVAALCTLTTPGGCRIVSAGQDGTVRVWDLETRRPHLEFRNHKGQVRALCTVTVRGEELVASAGDDQVVRIWDSRTGRQRHALQGHTGRISGLCTVPVDRRTLLASTSQDGTARLWDPATGTLELTIPVHHEATACIAAAGLLIVGLSAGILALSLNL